MEGSGSLSVPCGARDRESPAGQAGSKPASASRDVHQGVLFSSSATLDLSQSGLHHLGEIFKVPNLRQLHLQRNALSTIPKDFFQLLPNLSWLDLRFNRITALPSGIGCHKHLKTLLLERNPIRMLPVELVKKMTVRDLPQPLLDLPEERVPNQETVRSQAPKGSAVTGKAGFSPPVGTLEPHEPGRPTEPLEDWPSEDEIRRFWKLRQEIVETEQAGALGSQLLPAELPPGLRAALSSGRKPLPHPRPICRMKMPSFQGVLPELDSTQQALVRASQLGESRSLALQELRERQAQEQSRSGLRGQILEETLKPQAQQLQARRSRFRGLAPLEDVGRAARDVQMTLQWSPGGFARSQACETMITLIVHRAGLRLQTRPSRLVRRKEISLTDPGLPGWNRTGRLSNGFCDQQGRRR
ncbi:hypothetical protein JEQ12_011772 [Ovis aries]|uniref:Leucine-rich repeat-containing protein 27 n=1 Tax=Ovis aries TaxID=9940 RepID=A0A836CUM6_SHEEP|nr:hypothetical protein JEQ12_011772 [Ovis aries]